MDHIHHLSVVIGPRGTATEGEDTARRYIRDVFNSLEIRNTVEPFKTITSFSYPYICIYFLIIAGTVFLLFGYLITAMILSGLGGVLFFLENTSFELVGAVLPKKGSGNVTGYIPPGGQKRRIVIVTAHYDSSRSGIMFSPGFVKGFRNTFIGLIISLFSIFIFTGLYWITEVWWLKLLVSLLSIDPLVTIILLVHREIKGRYTRGANDNASGVGILLGIAERFNKERLNNTELYLVATGAEEVGMVGMIAFVKQHQDILKDAFIINIDNCGAGNIYYIIEEGMIKKYAADHNMVAVADRLRKEKFGNTAPRVFTTMSTDALVPLARGYRAMSVMAFDEDGTLPNWHWETDVFENVMPSTVDTGYGFISEIIKALDADA